MTPRERPDSRERAPTGTTQAMSERQNQSEMKETERDVKRRLREIAHDLESAQGATLPQLLDEIRKARSELTYAKTEIEEEIET